MKALIIKALLIFLALPLFSQGEDSTTDYVNMTPGKLMIYNMGDSKFQDIFLDTTVVLADQEYKARARYYFNTEKRDTAYLRKGEDAYYVWDEDSQSEFMEVPHAPVKGQAWFGPNDKWHYKILKTTGKISTAYGKHKDLLVIQARQIDAEDQSKYRVYQNHYKRGTGYVGSKVNGRVLSYLIAIR